MYDIIRLFEDYNVHYYSEGKNVSPGFVQTQCVFCDDNSNHLGWEMNGRLVNCWRCGWHPIKKALKELLSISYNEVENILLEYSGTSILRAKLNKRETLKEGTVELPGGRLMDMHKKYLRGRNFDPDGLERKYKLRGVGVAGDWKYRIIIPIIFEGQVVSFQARDITDKQKIRYKNLEISKSLKDPKKVLYNIDNCKGDSVGVVEGVTDAWRMGSNFVATFGTSLTPGQVTLISKFKKIFLCFDAEKEAQQRGRIIAEKLSVIGCEVELVQLHENKDPAELTDLEALCLKRGLGL